MVLEKKDLELQGWRHYDYWNGDTVMLMRNHEWHSFYESPCMKPARGQCYIVILRQSGGKVDSCATKKGQFVAIWSTKDYQVLHLVWLTIRMLTVNGLVLTKILVKLIAWAYKLYSQMTHFTCMLVIVNKSTSYGR